MADFSLIKKWVAAGTEEGLKALAASDPAVRVYDPVAAPKLDFNSWYDCEERVNCMAYALDWQEGYLHPGGVKPGSKSAVYEAFERKAALPGTFDQAVCKGLEEDGLEKVRDNFYKPGHYLTALFINRRRFDYHFMRMDSNGRWSQMNWGRKGLSFSDFSGEPITNPATANMGPDMSFIGFYHVPEGGAKALRATGADIAKRPVAQPPPLSPS